VPERAFVVLALVDSTARTLLVRRPRGGLLGGMWAFPERELEAGWCADDVRGAAVTLARQQLPASGPVPDVADVEPLPEVRHTFTHLRATYLPWMLRSSLPAPAGESDPDRRRVAPSAPGLPLPAAQKRILAMVEERVGESGVDSSRSGTS
jgi:A/G-specific adenine glycosylase